MGAHLASKVVRVRADRPLRPITVEERYSHVLLVVEVDGAVVGQVSLAASSTISPAVQWRAMANELGAAIWRERLRLAVGRAAGAEREGEPLGDSPRVSVVVCTRDRPEQLRECLAGLARLRTEPAEVLVVDNCPAGDATLELCQGRPVRYLREPVPGQARARNRGIAESTGELVAFTDDDCVVDPGWLDGLAHDFADPLVMAVTGHIGPLELESAAQVWFERHGGFERHPRRLVFDPEKMGPLRAAGVAGAGANMIFRREAFAHAGPFAEDLGPGTPARAADDKYAFYRLLAAGYRIVYDPARVVWHRHRADLPALRQVMTDYGAAEFAYSTRCLVEHREPYALVIWRWWLRHFLGDARRFARRAPGWVPLWLTLAEARGAASGPWRMLQSSRARRAIAPIEPSPATPAPAGSEVPIGARAEAPAMSVGITSRDRRESLRRVLLALAAQEYPFERFEVVVVLDGSTDGSAEMARALELPYRLAVVEQPQSGIAAGRNRAAREAAEEIVVFLDDDVDPEPGCLAAHADAHRRISGPLVVLGYYPPASKPESFWAMRQRAWWEDHFRRKADPRHQWTYVDFVGGNSSLRADVLFEDGGFDEDFRGRREDWELGVRLLERGVRFEYRPEAKGLHRLDTRFESGLRNARNEGRWDVMLADKHPQTKGHLPLVRIAEELELRPRRWPALHGPRTRGLPLGAAVQLADALEACRLRTRWRRLVDRLLGRSYALGVLDAIPDLERLREYLDPEAIRESSAQLALDLDDPAPPTLPAGAGAVELTLLSHGMPLAAIPATRPGEQWDPDDVAERAADLAGEAARLGIGVSGLSSIPPPAGR